MRNHTYKVIIFYFGQFIIPFRLWFLFIKQSGVEWLMLINEEWIRESNRPLKIRKINKGDHKRKNKDLLYVYIYEGLKNQKNR